MTIQQLFRKYHTEELSKSSECNFISFLFLTTLNSARDFSSTPFSQTLLRRDKRPRNIWNKIYNIIFAEQREPLVMTVTWLILRVN